jgi:hypothetical protein
VEKISKIKLIKFIAKAHKNTYAAPPEIRKKHKCKIPILKNHKDYEFKEGDFSYHDSYAGSTFAPGREVVFFKDNPIWAMAYQGQTILKYKEDFFEKKVFPFLKLALTNFDEKIPFRGPTKFTKGDFTYTFELIGDYTYFTAKEKVFYKKKLVFFQDVMGSIIK